MIKTSEFVSPKHPDKICDLIADSILDAFLLKDKNSRVAVEVMGGHGHITVSGEITSTAQVDIEKVVLDIVGDKFKVAVHATRQSSQIAQGVDTGGAGDQGIMVGYACNAENFMPVEYELARNLCKQIYEKYPYDGKVQVTVELEPIPTDAEGSLTKEIPRAVRARNGYRVLSVVASFQNTKTSELEMLVRSLIEAGEYLINSAGEWNIGGFDADSGLSGRKLVIDAYGPNVPVGGGSFSGKDYTKVDRSGAYMARKIAVDLIKQKNAREVLVKLAYAIGKPKPVMAVATIDGVENKIVDYDLTPLGIRKLLQLDQPIYANLAIWGHFGRNSEWDK